MLLNVRGLTECLRVPESAVYNDLTMCVGSIVCVCGCGCGWVGGCVWVCGCRVQACVMCVSMCVRVCVCVRVCIIGFQCSVNVSGYY